MSKEDFPITIRSARPGDVIVTAGGTKKVSRLFIDNKIPKSKRDTWPIVENSQGMIILVPHLAKILGIYIQTQYICGKIRNIYD